jgi:hypothetical protein
MLQLFFYKNIADAFSSIHIYNQADKKTRASIIININIKVIYGLAIRI